MTGKAKQQRKFELHPEVEYATQISLFVYLKFHPVSVETDMHKDLTITVVGHNG